MKKIDYYKKMYTIRQVEKTIEKYFERGVMRGTTHGYIGQEAIAVGILSNINMETDYVTSGHRCHGHYLALTDDIIGLAGEVMGKEIGVINGKGGSQHIKYKNFYTNGITGGMVPVAVGIGMSKKLKKENGLVISFLGDGAMNEGYVMEALNLSSVFSTPNIFILENNNYAMSTDTNKVTGGSFEKRVEGFGIDYKKIKALDVFQIEKTFKEVYKEVEKNKKPYFLEIETFRFCGHSKSDKKEYFDQEKYSFWLENDPLKKLQKEIKDVEKIHKEIDKNIEELFEKALNSKKPDPEKILKNVIH